MSCERRRIQRLPPPERRPGRRRASGRRVNEPCRPVSGPRTAGGYVRVAIRGEPRGEAGCRRQPPRRVMPVRVPEGSKVRCPLLSPLRRESDPRGGERWPHEDSSEAPSNGARGPSPRARRRRRRRVARDDELPYRAARGRIYLPRGRWYESRSAPDLTQVLRVRVRRYR